MKIQPLNDHVFIEPMSKEEKTAAGIVLPETVSKEKPMQGKIIAVGPGKLNEDGKRIPMSVKKGDVVLFTKYAPSEVKIDEKEYLVVAEGDILAIIEPFSKIA